MTAHAFNEHHGGWHRPRFLARWLTGLRADRRHRCDAKSGETQSDEVEPCIFQHDDRYGNPKINLIRRGAPGADYARTRQIDAEFITRDNAARASGGEFTPEALAVAPLAAAALFRRRSRQCATQQRTGNDLPLDQRPCCRAAAPQSGSPMVTIRLSKLPGMPMRPLNFARSASRSVRLTDGFAQRQDHSI